VLDNSCYNQKDMNAPSAPIWTVDGHGYLLTPSGCKAARVTADAIMLYDKREKAEYPLTLEDFYTLTGAMSHADHDLPG
jgi:hypothetical protein